MKISDLLKCIEASKTEIDIAVPDRDYYAKRDSLTTTQITYICPYKLTEALAAISNQSEGEST